jgi:hypothetical protein
MATPTDLKYITDANAVLASEFPAYRFSQGRVHLTFSLYETLIDPNTLSLQDAENKCFLKLEIAVTNEDVIFLYIAYLRETADYTEKDILLKLHNIANHLNIKLIYLAYINEIVNL